MKRAIIITVTLVFMFSVMGVTYYLCMNQVSELSNDDLVMTDKYVSADNVFTGRFKCTEPGKNICKYEYEIRDEKLYLTLYVTPGNKDLLPLDEQGYAQITINAGSEFREVRYIAKDKETDLSFERE